MINENLSVNKKYSPQISIVSCQEWQRKNLTLKATLQTIWVQEEPDSLD